MADGGAQGAGAVADPAEVERALATAEAMRQHLAVLEEQRAILAANLDEARRAGEALEAMKAAKPGDALLLPLGAGAFTRASVLAPDRVLTNVGRGVHVESDVDEAARHLAERASQTEATMRRLTEDAQRVERELGQLLAALQGLRGA